MTVPWYGILPFAALLAAIATFPLMHATKHLWEKRRFQLLVALVLGLPMAAWCWSLGGRTEVIHALVEYASFIALLFSLFVVSGGVFVAGDIQATPWNNTLFLGAGAVLASLIGTTGAAMLLVRPLLNTNRERKHKVHTVVFTILVVANCGGLLTPLGDPPLFLGLLRGVPFLWTLKLLPQWLFVNGMLLLTYHALDSAAFRKEEMPDLVRDAAEVKPLSLEGKGSIALLGVIVAGLIIIFTGQTIADPIVSILIALLILPRTWSLLSESVNILLESAPQEIDVADLEQAMLAVDGVDAVHDSHVWSISSGFLVLSTM